MSWLKQRKKRETAEISSENIIDPERIPEEKDPAGNSVSAPASDGEKTASAEDGGDEDGGRSLFGRLRNGLKKTRDILTTDIDELLAGSRIDEDLLEEIEQRLITSDMGVETAMELMDTLRSRSRKLRKAEELPAVLKEEIAALMRMPCPDAAPVTVIGARAAGPRVIMMVGVNGVGKTTTIGKLADLYRREGKAVLVVAADTFRAAAVEQLEIWARRSGADFVRHKDQADPASVAFDGVQAGAARKKDVVIIDTAGRLHTRKNLMEELKKIRRAVSKAMPGAPHETLLVLDATTGQNGLSQAARFHDAMGLTGLVLTKLDGTAKGGIVVGLNRRMKIPLRFVGVGEGVADLQSFDPETFAEALLTP